MIFLFKINLPTLNVESNIYITLHSTDNVESGKMSTLQVSKKNSPVSHTGNKDLFSRVVESLSLEAREVLANEFYEELKEIRSRQAASQLARGRKHMSNETIMELISRSSSARKRVLELAKEEAEKVLQAIEAIEEDVQEGQEDPEG
ncbi:hypothetical protein [Sulfuracidifex tepidarius]|uniref:Uncharacterized protein n=1 Tax=Sulfuracidifex tepidarius TaxID=1294262 RepID=A0A510E4A0_9CREN|nr:hypothetical protein [Sulfuracidifex tepidarius]BBG27287.1 hypothetical protein IC007_1832 [Sulfuracidifex tepidarius]